MTDVSELLAQKAALEAQITSALAEKRAGAIAQVRELMAQHGLSVRDISGQASTQRMTIARASTGKAGKVAAKYRDAVTGNAWSGRGLKPIWLRTALENGHKLEEFAVA